MSRSSWESEMYRWYGQESTTTGNAVSRPSWESGTNVCIDGMDKKAPLQAMPCHGLVWNQKCIDGTMDKKPPLQAMPCHGLVGN